MKDTLQKDPKFPGVPAVIHGNGAIAQVMGQVCGGVIGYPITPSTEIAEIYEAFRAGGGVNIWGRHPFFFEPEGEHSAQSGALGAALTGGQYISNASSSQGILYGIESHYVTVGKKVGGFVMQVAARSVSRHSLNVMAGHDDVYALLPSGYTILFGSNPQEAADLAAISYKVSSLSMIPVANAMDGFVTSHMMSEVMMPEDALLEEFVGDPNGRIPCPTVAQEMLFGAKGRVFHLKRYLGRHSADLAQDDYVALVDFLDANAEAVEKDNEAALVDQTLARLPEELHAQWRRQWKNAFEKGTRQRVPAQVDVHNPGLTGGVQNQPDYQAGAVDHRTHFVRDVPRFVREAMDEYTALTGRHYSPVKTFECEDAETVLVGLGSVTDDAEAIASYLRRQGRKVGVVSIKMLQPFPEAELVAALKGKRAVTILERSDVTALTGLVNQALVKAVENAAGTRYPGIEPLSELPKLTTAIFGLGAHDLQPRHLIAAYDNMDERCEPFVYLGSQFFSKTPSPQLAALQDKLRAAYPETELMALETKPNPRLLPDDGLRIRFHSVGGYGTIATGKLLTDILANALQLHSKAAPKYGSEKSGAPTNYYITLSPEEVKITNADLEDVEVVVSPDHKVFAHSNPLRGLVEGGTFVLQSQLSPLEVWEELPSAMRKFIVEKKIRFFVLDGFSIAKKHAPRPELETRMMGIAFIGAICGNVERITEGASDEAVMEKIRTQIAKKFGGKGQAVVDGNMAVIRDGAAATVRVDYTAPEFVEVTAKADIAPHFSSAISGNMCRIAQDSSSAGLFDAEYFEETVGRPTREGTVGEAPVLPGVGMFMPSGTAAARDKGLFRRDVPVLDPSLCTGCLECTMVCPDAAIPATVVDIDDLLKTALKEIEMPAAQRETVRDHIRDIGANVRAAYLASKEAKGFGQLVSEVVDSIEVESAVVKRNLKLMAEGAALLPVSRTRPFFDAMEAERGGSGGLFAVVVDPWKCSGCLECIELCGPGALSVAEQDEPLLEKLQAEFEFLSKTPNTPARFIEHAFDPGGDIKRMMLDRDTYYATTGGHGACRGCGEVTALRQVVSATHAIHDRKLKTHVHELEDLIAELEAKLPQVGDDAARKARITDALKVLEKRLFLMEGGPTGNGPAAMVVANATGCSSVYASTFPYNPYQDPWVNSLFQDGPALSKGIFEGITASTNVDFKAMRVARLELADAYDTADEALLRKFEWQDYNPAERALLPTVINISGDGAAYDIGFGALSRLLASNTPVKVMVLNSGVYSNTGGQASTASLSGQDSDLSRFGPASHGKQEDRKELGMIAAFHPEVYVVQSATAMPGHFLKSLMGYLQHSSSPALLDVYTPCQAEHGIADAAAAQRAKLAVEARVAPLFVHDPKAGETIEERFSLDGNPAVDKDWTTVTLEYIEDGKLQLKEVSLTPAHFAFDETRFKKQFRPLSANANAVPIEDFINLPKAERVGKAPYVLATDAEKRLIKLEVGNTVVHLVEERRRSWRTLQHLAGQVVDKLDAAHHAEIDALQARYEEAVEAREASMDSIATGMSALAAASGAPAAVGMTGALAPVAGAAPTAAAAAPAGNGGALPHIAEEDIAKCSDCKTCYQEIPELFELTKMVVDGEARNVARTIPGALEKIEITDELRARVARVAANCDSEIIK
ncbi:2-oxoacid:acceptor oxidoreductase family protein [Aliiruegeria sabulilitoris]|uniref:2-oxoacid:acceptor oxidoreductase family protein n=1 Tax=Aliiruegeria sabulilitoris TaxID=1510458 RepID=UPI00082DCF47|nr:2-oxoacid:acceptor oxidoreductase family protein [Aliiruegeria sabulilitoris]NDR59455.1 pyruvate-flavodoxin oxidoreductase [Pseudoruegeria sp. M32A2M]